jgi:plastocyanin
MTLPSAIFFREPLRATDSRPAAKFAEIPPFGWGRIHRVLVAARATCKTLALLLTAALSGQLFAGTVTGYTRLIQSSDSAVKKRGDFSGVVVWLTSIDDPPAHAARKHAQMLQKNKRFSPHILPIETGTAVDFPNLDPIFHNAFSNYDGQLFDVALYPPGTSRTVRFDRPGIVRVFCNIHPSMSAIIVVVNSNHFTTTDRDGRYSLLNVCPGKYQVHFFHERATPETLANLTQDIAVGNNVKPLALATISEAGYLPVAHKNKYGEDYPVDGDKIDDYSPLRK